MTGDPQTQAQMRNTIANLDATMQKANSLLGELGGTSSVYGVDPGATPAPVPAPGGSASPLRPTITPYPGFTPYAAPAGPYASPTPLPGKPLPPQNSAQLEKMHKSIGDLAKSLVEIQLRAGMLNAQTVRAAIRS